MAKEPSNQPPYVGFGVFMAATDQLYESIVPTGPLDRHVLHGFSGGDYGALMSGLRFLGLIDDERKATAEYRALVQIARDRPKFKEALLELIDEKYAPIIAGVDMKQGTAAQLEKAFKDAGVAQGQMLTKTTRFLLKALAECGVKVSPHITKPKPRTPRATNGKPMPDKTRGKPTASPRPSAELGSDTPRGFERMPLPGVVGAFIQYPMDITDAQCDLLESVIGVLRAYAKARAGGREKKA